MEKRIPIFHWQKPKVIPPYQLEQNPVKIKIGSEEENIMRKGEEVKPVDVKLCLLLLKFHEDWKAVVNDTTKIFSFYSLLIITLTYSLNSIYHGHTELMIENKEK